MRSMTFCNTGLGVQINIVIMDSHAENTKRIAKNTLMLYVRMLFSMLVSLYTSRVVLNTLGVEDYGIYNVVGGFVAMFSLISSSLSASVSRFLTFELGRGDMERLKETFSTSLLIHLVLAGIVFILAETVGIWFLNTQMTIPAERLYAANWVFQASIVSFMFSLSSVPYNASITSHERMSAFAYIGILDVVLRLLIVLFIAYAPFLFDRLIVYSLLLVCVGMSLQCIYLWYCRKNFEECRFRLYFHKELWKEMSAFAGWNFLSSGAYLFNTQGINILMNLFFGVGINAARGVAAQVDAAVQAFVGNFTTALNPQITKSYASNDLDYMHTLICRGAKYSYFLMFFFVVPLIMETSQVLSIWLVNIPDHAVMFVRLALLSSLVTIIGNTLFTAQMATGNIKKYQITVTVIGLWVFPVSYILFKLGLPPESAYVVYILVYFSLIFVRIYLVKDLIKMPWQKYLKDVLFKITIVSVCSCVIPCLFYFNMQPSFIRLLTICIVSTVSTIIFMYLLGLEKSERSFIKSRIQNKFGYLKH